jgi:hypothetical protein
VHFDPTLSHWGYWMNLNLLGRCQAFLKKFSLPWIKRVKRIVSWVSPCNCYFGILANRLAYWKLPSQSQALTTYISPSLINSCIIHQSLHLLCFLTPLTQVDDIYLVGLSCSSASGREFRLWISFWISCFECTAGLFILCKWLFGERLKYTSAFGNESWQV